MEEKAFNEKDVIPDESMVSEALGPVYAELEAIRSFNLGTLGETREGV